MTLSIKGFEPLPGEAQPIAATQYSCSKANCDISWVRRSVGQPIPNCPVHHIPLVPVSRALKCATRSGWTASETFLTQKAVALPLTQLMIALLIVVVFAIVVQRFELPTLKFLEGYWFRWLRPLRRWLINRQIAQASVAEQQFQLVSQKGIQALSPDEIDEYVRLDWRLRQIPAQSDRRMPTRLGNILRAAERRPLEKYGLDAVICFPRLWLLLPTEVKTELVEARAQLNTMVRIWIWSVLFLGWGVWSGWAIGLGIFSAWLAHRWMLAAAIVYGDLVEAAFDLHRTALYKSVRWRLPNNPIEEQQMGRSLTNSLWRGFTEPEPNFKNLDEKE